MTRTTALLLGLGLALLVVAVLCAAAHRAPMEDDLAVRAADALAVAGHTGLDITAENGRDIRLAGVVADDATRDAASETAAAVFGVRRVLNDLVVATPAAPADLRVAAADGVVTLSGAVADGRTLESLVALAKQRFPRMTVADELVLDPQAEGPRDRLGALLIEAFDPRTAPGSLKLAAGELVVTGRVGSVERRAEIGRRLADLFAGTAVLNRLEVSAQLALDEVLALQRVEFESGSDRLTAAGGRTLDEVGAVLAGWPDVQVEISGHTDASGDPAFNLELSRRRAETARQYLAQTVDDACLTAVGFGSERPIASNDTAEGRLANRRIEFRVMGDDER